ncbi:MAG: hypothetical protein HND38_18945 [Planctomycetes bacterium]|nr:hypothetical protein [Planctomycetota bacterium]
MTQSESEPTPESPSRRGLRDGYCEGGFGAKDLVLIVRLGAHDEVYPIHT